MSNLPKQLRKLAPFLSCWEDGETGLPSRDDELLLVAAKEIEALHQRAERLEDEKKTYESGWLEAEGIISDLRVRAKAAEARERALLETNQIQRDATVEAASLRHRLKVAEAERDRLREAHEENARILGYLENEMQGRVEAGKVGALSKCAARSRAALRRDEGDDE